MNFVIVGYGSIASALMPILKKEFGHQIKSIEIIDPEIDSKIGIESQKQHHCTAKSITSENYRETLKDLNHESFMINLSINVSSVDLLKYCQEKGARYIDTCIEPWEGLYFDASVSPESRTNYALREAALEKKHKTSPNNPTAIIAHGANPGLVSHFVKQALLNIRQDIYGIKGPIPVSRQDWAKLSYDLGIKTIHIAEHDTQIPVTPKKNRRVRQHLVRGWIH